jgi:hypothetical protein
VVLAVVHDQPEVDLREPLAEGRTRARAAPRVGEVSTRVDHELAALGESIPIQLVESPGLLATGAARRVGGSGRGRGGRGTERAEAERGTRSGGEEAPPAGKAGHWATFLSVDEEGNAGPPDRRRQAFT